MILYLCRVHSRRVERYVFVQQFEFDWYAMYVAHHPKFPENKELYRPHAYFEIFRNCRTKPHAWPSTWFFRAGFWPRYTSDVIEAQLHLSGKAVSITVLNDFTGQDSNGRHFDPFEYQRAHQRKVAREFCVLTVALPVSTNALTMMGGI